MVQLKRWLLHKYLKIRTTLPFVYLCNKADAEERLHVCFTINASIISVKHFTCDLFHFRYLFKMRCNSLKCVIIFVVRKQVLCHYFNELSFFVVYRDEQYQIEICQETLRRFLRASGIVYKRTRHSLKKKDALNVMHKQNKT